MNKRLKKAILKNLNYSDLKDVCEHGADAGFNGFIYYTDTIKFYKKYKKEIIEIAENLAYDLGEDMLIMISNFNCLKQLELSTYEIVLALENKGDNDTKVQVQNAMAWFALEEVSRYIVDEKEGNNEKNN